MNEQVASVKAFCPKCGSRKVYCMLPADIEGGEVYGVWKCRRCGEEFLKEAKKD